VAAGAVRRLAATNWRALRLWCSFAAAAPAGRSGRGQTEVLRGMLRLIGLLKRAVLAGVAALVVASAARAAQPRPWEMDFQPPATPIMTRLEHFHNELQVIIFAIAIFVMALLVFVMVRFRASRNPVPTRTTHYTVIEILWTVVPVVILVSIAIPSFKLMYYMDQTPNAKMTIKVTGHQWYWTYAYPDQGNISFDSNIVSEKDLKPGQLRLLTVDNPLVVPVGTVVRVQVTSTDVIHSWFMQSFGVQEYAVPGRLNEAWFEVEHQGVYHGQCNQICGINHADMPIVVEAMTKDDFQHWLGEAKKKFASDQSAPRIAAADPLPAHAGE
jgi:cytochrome c oxidase subunit II